MTTLLLQLILAHIIGDFLFQPRSWVVNKETYKHRSQFLYWHIAIHIAALVITLKFDFQYWIGILIIVISHGIIDVTKLFLQETYSRRWLFFIDQLAHLVVISIVYAQYEPIEIDWNTIYTNDILLITVFTLLVTFAGAIVMKTIISKWADEATPNDSSLPDAGKYIGMLERFLTFIFIINDQWGAIGFLIAAKSVFRFGDLTSAKNRKLTEYILVGTLLSFWIAILLGILYLQLSTS